MEERGSDYTESDEESDREEKWDCQTILSTFTNTDNHPGVIKTTRVVKPKQNRLDLHKQLKVPIDGLVAEEIDLKQKEKLEEKAKKLSKQGPYAVDEEIESGSESEDENEEGTDNPSDLKK